MDITAIRGRSTNNIISFGFKDEGQVCLSCLMLKGSLGFVSNMIQPMSVHLGQETNQRISINEVISTRRGAVDTIETYTSDGISDSVA